MENKRFVSTMVANATQQNLSQYITVEDINGFLSSQGYEWSGYYGDYFDRNLRFPYQYFDGAGYTAHIDRKMIVIGTEDEWGEHVSMGIDGVSAKCVNNPFVKYVRQSIDEFKIYNIVRVDAIKDATLSALNAGMYGAFKLEKDLSNEWKQYLELNNSYIKDVKCQEWDKQVQQGNSI